MKAAIRQRALALGFDDCRFTTADAPESAPRFEQWLACEEHGEMGWLKRTAGKRADPRQVLPGARSIISLAVSYMQKEPGAGQAGDCGPQTTDHRPQTTDHSPQSTVHRRRTGGHALSVRQVLWPATRVTLIITASWRSL